MNLNRCSVLVLIVFALYMLGSDISAPKMEIIDTAQGRMTVFPQGITITDKDTKITGQNAVFYQWENRARVSDSVLITTPQFTINADTVFYAFDKKQSQLKGNVIVESDTLKIETQELLFQQIENLVSSIGIIKIREKIQKLSVIGQEGKFNFTDQTGQFNKEPVLYIERQDTTVVYSEQMTLDNKKSEYIARNNVSAVTNNSKLNCDSLVFYTDENYGIAFGSPRLTDRQNRISGQLIKFFFSDSTDNNENTLKNIAVYNQAYGFYVTDDGGQLEVEGSQFSINYQDKEIENIEVFGDSLNYVTGRFIPKQEL